MAAVYDFTVPFTLTSPYGTFPLNSLVSDTAGMLGYLMLVHADCESGTDLRIIRDDVPQASGEISHLHYKAGYEMRLKGRFYQAIGESAKPLCGHGLVLLADLLQLHLNALIDDDPIRPLAIVADPLGLTRIQWTPTGIATNRMLDRIRLIDGPVFAPVTDADGLIEVTFSLMSDRPYAMDAPQTQTLVANSATIVNGGTSDYYPVSRIHGPFNTFTYRNNSLLDENGQPVAIVYDAGNPGANSVGSGHYIEIDHWANTVYLDGNVANYLPGLTISQCDFWQLQPGPNTIQITGGYTGTGVDLLWQNAYA
jgi:hypothetical protein